MGLGFMLGGLNLGSSVWSVEFVDEAAKKKHVFFWEFLDMVPGCG